MSTDTNGELREQIYKICRNNKEYEASELIMPLIEAEATKAKDELLDELANELPIAERMAWANEDGSLMETKVFQTNMRSFITAHKSGKEKV